MTRNVSESHAYNSKHPLCYNGKNSEHYSSQILLPACLMDITGWTLHAHFSSPLAACSCCCQSDALFYIFRNTRISKWEHGMFRV